MTPSALADVRAAAGATAERDLILGAIASASGNRSAAARALGLSRRHLFRRVAQLELTPALRALATLHGWAAAPTNTVYNLRARLHR